jgi:hypothetical protein
MPCPPDGWDIPPDGYEDDPNYDDIYIEDLDEPDGPDDDADDD